MLKVKGSKSESNAFHKKLDTYPVFQAWLQDISRRNMAIDRRLFEIVRLRGGGFQLAVNFDPQIIHLCSRKWGTCCGWISTSNLAKDAKRVYPHAVIWWRRWGRMGRLWIWWKTTRVLSGYWQGIEMSHRRWLLKVGFVSAILGFTRTWWFDKGWMFIGTILSINTTRRGIRVLMVGIRGIFNLFENLLVWYLCCRCVSMLGFGRCRLMRLSL